ncbi:MAG TPA: helix-turn-helix domain-containing protein [Solirubrobacteraceae bacterium]|nr:helix-turn-helix domain-containing protein [Solirubrobacteraceae bacterium]
MMLELADNSLRAARRQAGLTQAELATRAGVSRQLIAAVESGHNTPAVDAALRLARALGTTVESLFSSSTAEVVPALGRQLREGTPLRVGRVGDQLVAAELPDHGVAGAAWARPDGVIESGDLRLFPGASPAAFVLAGCDPALGVAEAMLHGLGSRSLLALPAATGVALGGLKAGRIHAAVVHGRDGELPVAPLPVVRVHFARWQVGIGHPPGLRVGDLEALLGRGVPIVQREAAASSQQAFRRAAAGLGLSEPPASPLAEGHIDAARMAAMLGCAAVTTESAARAFDLGFVALEGHTVEIWVAERWVEHPALDALGDVLSSAAFTDRIGRFGGYELAGCGSRV